MFLNTLGINLNVFLETEAMSSFKASKFGSYANGRKVVLFSVTDVELANNAGTATLIALRQPKTNPTNNLVVYLSPTNEDISGKDVDGNEFKMTSSKGGLEEVLEFLGAVRDGDGPKLLLAHYDQNDMIEKLTSIFKSAQIEGELASHVEEFGDVKVALKKFVQDMPAESSEDQYNLRVDQVEKAAAQEIKDQNVSQAMKNLIRSEIVLRNSCRVSNYFIDDAVVKLNATSEKSPATGKEENETPRAENLDKEKEPEAGQAKKSSNHPEVKREKEYQPQTSNPEDKDAQEEVQQKQTEEKKLKEDIPGEREAVKTQPETEEGNKDDALNKDVVPKSETIVKKEYQSQTIHPEEKNAQEEVQQKQTEEKKLKEDIPEERKAEKAQPETEEGNKDEALNEDVVPESKTIVKEEEKPEETNNPVDNEKATEKPPPNDEAATPYKVVLFAVQPVAYDKNGKNYYIELSARRALEEATYDESQGFDAYIKWDDSLGFNRNDAFSLDNKPIEEKSLDDGIKDFIKFLEGTAGPERIKIVLSSAFLDGDDANLVTLAKHGNKLDDLGNLVIGVANWVYALNPSEMEKAQKSMQNLTSSPTKNELESALDFQQEYMGRKDVHITAANVVDKISSYLK